MSKSAATSPTPTGLRPEVQRLLILESWKRREEARRRKLLVSESRNSLLPFIEYTKASYQADAFHRELCRIFEQFLWDVIAGKRPRVVVSAPPQHGKLLAMNTPIFTPRGWRQHGALAPGDTVFGRDGKPVRVIAVAPPVQCNREVEFTDGTVLQCHADHEWVVFDRTDHRPGEHTYETREMERRGTWIGTPGQRGGRARFQVDANVCLEMPEAKLPVHPYVLGAWLGDGKADGNSFSHHREDLAVMDRIESLGFPLRNRYTQENTGVVYSCFSGLRVALRAADLLDNKHIPTAYLTASARQRLELLAGLIDTDGYIYHKNGRVTFSNANQRLVEDVATLIRTLGWRATVAAFDPCTSSSGICGKQVIYQITFNPTEHLPLALPRKQTVSVNPARRRRGIVAIRQIRNGPMGRCIQVEGGIYLAGETMIPTHNSEIVSRRFPTWAIGKFPSLRFVCSSYASVWAEALSGDRVRILNSPEFKDVFPELRLTKQTGSNIETSAGGFMLAAGVDQGITGRSVDIGVIDDPIKGYKEAVSETVRNSIHNWYRTDFFTRLQKGAGVIVTMCMTGDTPVLRPDGSETLLRNIRPGDKIATYRDGVLSTSTVVNWINHGTDRVHEIKTSSGIIVKANERHPFLVRVGKKLQWLRLRDLRLGDEICRVTATSQSDTSRQQKPQKLSQLTSDFTLDQILEIRPAGTEDVFDIEVADTENFIANGLVSHNTRWHEDDLVGRLIDEMKGDGEQWQIYNFPALAGEDDPLGRKPGDPLAPGRFDLPHLDAIKRVQGSYAWGALYQGNPAPAEGLMLRRTFWRYYRAVELPGMDMIVVSVDATFKDSTDADHVAIHVWGFVGPRGYALDRVCDRMGYTATKAAVKAMSLQWRATVLLIEDKANGPAIIEELSREIGGAVRVIAVNPSGGKLARAWPFSADLEAGNAYLPAVEEQPWSAEIVDYAAKFPASAMDHDIDAITQVFNWRRENMHGLFEFYKKENEANQIEIQQRALAKVATPEEITRCPKCESIAVRADRTPFGRIDCTCNQCGHSWRVTPAGSENDAPTMWGRDNA